MKGMKAYILDIGNTYCDSNWIVAMDTFATTSDRDVPRKWIACPQYSVLIQHPTVGWILYDTGPSPDSNDVWPESILTVTDCKFTEQQTMEYQLSLLGLTPADINVVIISHMHMDHIGNIKLFKDTADFYVSRADAQAAFTTVYSTPDKNAHGFYYKDNIIVPLKNLTYIEEDTKNVLPGIDFLVLPGHTDGVLGAVLHMEGGTIILASDAICRQENFDGSAPGIVADSAVYFNSVEKVKALKAEYNAQVWYGHDSNQFPTLKKAPDFYE